MESTRKLFYEAPSLFVAEAIVLFMEGPAEAPLLVLDRTIFYPEGGGQPCDLGTIGPIAGGEAAEVAAVTEERRSSGELLVLHAMAGPCAFRPGDAVRLSVHGDRRVDYSQQHTAEHLLGSIALRRLGANVVSVRFGAERSTIDFDLPSISEEELAAIEEAAEAAIAEDYPVRSHVCPPEDVASLPLRRPPPAGEEVLRVVEIDGLDFSPCCGLHRGSTGELRLLRIQGAEKYKGMTRLYFVAGTRAAADYRSVSRIAQGAARALGSPLHGLAEAAAREVERRKALEYAVAGLERERAQAEAAAAPELAAPAPRDGAPRLALRRFADRSAASLMVSAKSFAEAGMLALFASLPDLTVQALAPSPEARLGERFKGPLVASGGKGGGGPASFRAAFVDEESLDLFIEKALSSFSTAC